MVCWEEGSTDLVELCDDCWYEIRVLEHEYLTPVQQWKKIYPNPFGVNQAKDWKICN